MPTINISPAHGKKNLSGANKYDIVYQAPANCLSVTVNARLTSQDRTVDKTVRLAIVDMANPPVNFTDGGIVAPADTDWILPIGTKLGPTGIITGFTEDSGIVLSPNEAIVAMSDVTGVTARVHGFVRTAI